MFRNFKFTVLAARLPKTSRMLKRATGARIALIPISLFTVVLLLAVYLLSAFNGSSVAKPAPPIYWGFEDGTLQGWQIVSDPSTAGPLIANHALFHNNPGIPYNKEGTYFLSTIEAPPGTCGNGYCDSYTVTLVSPQFTLESSHCFDVSGWGQQFYQLCSRLYL